MHPLPIASKSIALLCVGFLAIQQLHAEDWQQFRGPTGQGTTSLIGMPTQWDVTKETAWTFDDPGKGWSSPVVLNGRIYLTTAVPVGEETVASEGKFSRRVNNPFSLEVFCLDEKTGSVIWSTPIAEVPAKVSIHPKNSHASATPIVTKDRLYVHFGIYATAALDLDGNIVWQRDVKFKPVHGCGGSPVLYQDLLIFHCDGGDQAFVIALDKATGETRWQTERSVAAQRSFSFSTPLVIETESGDRLISPASDAVYAYDPKTGEEKWQVRYPEKWSIVPRPVYADGLILVCTGYEGKAELLAIRPGGSGDVTETHVAWRNAKFVPYNPSPVVAGKMIFTVSDDGIASCRSLSDGEIIWKERLGGNYSASPFLADGKLYFLSEDGECTIIKASETFEEVAKNKVDERTLASMVPVNGGLLLRTAEHLYRID
ncbi:PQQ-binding-like beta-propeller repeat protein [Roseiconus lacunae]|uniref:outer membrane protein assembly factor BamB family protein n=1 Tax=Roseiconus lacunae TaxID=2605694 RepID=UPI003090B198|nr:PQQ-binding-like beta-propeller repeat protein [Stieleria sp. HD01]